MITLEKGARYLIICNRKELCFNENHHICKKYCIVEYNGQHSKSGWKAKTIVDNMKCRQIDPKYSKIGKTYYINKRDPFDNGAEDIIAI